MCVGATLTNLYRQCRTVCKVSWIVPTKNGWWEYGGVWLGRNLNARTTPSNFKTPSSTIARDLFHTSPILLICLMVCRSKKAAERRMDTSHLAEKEGFEPSIRQKPYTGFRVQRIRPLCHFSVCKPQV